MTPLVQAAGPGRAVRWILLLCTVIGLTTMHTLGHAGMPPHAHGHPAAAGDVAAVVAVSAGDCPDGHCPGDHGGMSGWAVCLAILGGLAAAVLLTLLLRRKPGLLRSGTGRLSALRVPRPPPRRWMGLTVASVAVLRV